LELFSKRILDRFIARTGKSRELWEAARKVMPDGGGSDMQCYYPYPVYMERAEGSKLYDVDGNKYIDFFNGAGTVMLGHRSPVILQAVEDALKKGIPTSVAYQNEIEYASMLRKHMPGMELIRFLPSGSEANSAAIRIARKFTGRSKIAKFEGGYHGQAQELLVSIEPVGPTCGPAHQPCGIAWHSAIPQPILELVVILPFNNTKASVAIIEKNAADLAAVIVEPVLVHGGMIPADSSYLHAIKDTAARQGILLIFDEVITGLRLGLGGAQELYGMTADLTVLAKPAGGGYPLGVLGGRKDVMSVILMERMQDKICVAGSTSGHSLGIAAGLALLKELEKGDYYRHVQELASMAAHRLQKIFDDAGVTCRVTGDVMGLWRGFWPHFSDKAPRDSRDFYKEDLLKLLNFYIGMIAHGVFMSPTGVPSLSLAHTQEDIDCMLKAAASVLKMLQPA
jgi:glutamate-1-semialdehyde 2,1-aminomutase